MAPIAGIARRLPPVLLCALAACARSSESEEAQRDLKRIASWVASVEMVVEERLRDAIPPGFAERSLERTQEELAQKSEELRKTGGAAPPRVGPELQRFLQVAGTAQGCAEATAAQIRARCLAEIKAAAGRLKALTQGAR